jgi:iturin family lipopeptide synthetase A
MSTEGIAIIGMDGRFPGAETLDKFWQNLCHGVESITRFTDEELIRTGIGAEKLRDPAYVKARATMTGAELFDAGFFGFTPHEAELMDPQHRIFLETAWHALEDAGYDPEQYSGAIGVYAGLSLNTYLLANLCSDPERARALTQNYQTGELTTLLGNDKDFLTTRVSYKLNLRGPAMTVQSACSTSLVAVAEACQNLLNYQCDMALAGGVSISFPQQRGYLFEPGGITSADGHCRPFDAEAQGTVFGDGVGIVVLKRLNEAQADHDHIYAVIKGYALNNDGASKMGYFAPSVTGQAEVIATAHAMAGIAPETIGYVETHGTATPIGDPIELTALTRAFRVSTDKKNFCAIGSVKSNIGHLEAASGVAGLIKTALSLKHRQIPPTLHFQTPNPQLELPKSPFYLASKLIPWPQNEFPRRAGVSSFGVGGTNAHLVLEEAPEIERSPLQTRSMELIVLSAKNRPCLEKATERLVAHLEMHPEADLADVAYTLQVGRRAFGHRRILFARDVADAIAILKKRDPARIHSRQVMPLPSKPVAPKETFGTLAKRWLEGEDIHWGLCYQGAQETRRRVPLPGYPFERTKHWIDPIQPSATSSPERPTAVAATVSAAVLTSTVPPVARALAIPEEPQKDWIITKLKTVLGNLSGQDLDNEPSTSSFFDLGFDSLFLTQAGQAFRKEFGVKVTFRQLLEELATLDAVAAYLGENMAPNELASPPLAVTESANGAMAVPATKKATITESAEGKRFGPFKPIDQVAFGGLNEHQEAAIAKLTRRYNARTPGSKTRTQDDRKMFSDPRTASSFNRLWKEMVYPIIVDRSEGSRLWDIDGNEYIDLTMGFGTNLLGHAPQFVRDAIAEQLKRGMEVGPSTLLAGKVAKLICEFTGMERVAFCNTGSEAILAAIRMARTVTGRTRIATTGGFHGICDEVLVRSSLVGGIRKTIPIAPGIPDHMVSEVLVLDYGSQASLEVLQAHAHELAAVLIEPVQGRHPDLQPRDFLKEARRITRKSETAFVMDEVITGFRSHPGGAQALFDVRADIATYGKIIGGGMPIGAVAGRSEYLDALDGGNWQYGDNSFPAVGVTFFAGTYIRHPLTMAASWSVLNYLKKEGPELQRKLNDRTHEFVRALNQFLTEQNAPLHFEQFSSFFYPRFHESVRWGSLLFYYLREKGIHIWEGRIWFLSTAHTEADLERIFSAFKESMEEMQAAGFLSGGRSDHLVSVEFMSNQGKAHGPSIVRERDAVIQNEPIGMGDPHDAIDLPSAGSQGEFALQPIQFSLYFFGSYPAIYQEDKYQLILDAARFADINGFHAIWLPERHFHPVGGYSPNPSVMAAALARETKFLRLNAGSVVAPLHHPVRVAEEWSLVDNLSGGRVGMSIASGWHPNDFIFAPNAFDRRRELGLENLAIIRKLWRGEALTLRTGVDDNFTFQIHPLPKQAELPLWLTCISKASYAKAGELGIGALGYLMNQSIEELAEKISIYRESLTLNGHDSAKAQVTILLHTFVGKNLNTVRETARGPLKEYLRSFLDNSQKGRERISGPVNIDGEDVEYMLEKACNHYIEGNSLIGTPESCAKVLERLQRIGVNEVGCFIDFGIEPAAVLSALAQLVELTRLSPAVSG